MKSRASNFLCAAAIALPATGFAHAAPRDLFPSYFDLYPVGEDPYGLVAADFNGDGRPDVAVGCMGGYDTYAPSVDILLGLEDGSFAPAVSYEIGSTPYHLDAADLDADGDIDVAVAGSGSVFVLLNEGDGAFASAISYDSLLDPFDIAIGDMDGDGDPDLVCPRANSHAVTILLNDGHATFDDVLNLPSPSSPFAIALGDLDVDGDLDIVTANENGDYLSVFENDGEAGFAVRRDYPLFADPSGQDYFSVDLGDLDGDGFLDVVVASWTDGTYSLLMNNGDGRLALPTPLLGGQGLYNVALADLNLDGLIDLTAANIQTGLLEVRLGQGGAEFAPPRSWPTGSSVYDADFVDINADGWPDVIASTWSEDAVAVSLNQGDATFPSPQIVEVMNEPLAVWTNDLDRDGDQDVIALTDKAFAAVVLNEGDGELVVDHYPLADDSDTPVYAFEIGDLTGDEFPDLVVKASGQSVRILPNDGVGRFEAPVLVGSGGYDVTLGDFNGDGLLDFAVANPVAVWINQGGLEFTALPAEPVGFSPRQVDAADLNGDGALDLLATDSQGRKLGVCLNDGSGACALGFQLLESADASRPQFADVNGDGFPDIIGASFYAAPITIRFNDGEGGFSDSLALPAAERIAMFTARDLNGDDFPEIAAIITPSNSDPYRILIFVNHGDGTFASPTELSINRSSRLFRIGDIDLDGDPDIITGSQAVDVLLNNGDATFQPLISYPHGRFSDDFVLSDMDGDHDLDVVKLSPLDHTIQFIPNLGCFADLDGDDGVGAGDLSALLDAWGPCGGCPADLTHDGVVNADDLFALLGRWGDCSSF